MKPSRTTIYISTISLAVFLIGTIKCGFKLLNVDIEILSGGFGQNLITEIIGLTMKEYRKSSARSRRGVRRPPRSRSAVVLSESAASSQVETKHKAERHGVKSFEEPWRRIGSKSCPQPW